MNHNRGLIRFIFLIIMLVLILSYFNFDIRGFIEQPQTQQNITYVTGGAILLWDEYLSRPILWFWNTIFLDLLWNSFVDNLTQIKDGQPEDLQLNAPQVITP